MDWSKKRSICTLLALVNSFLENMTSTVHTVGYPLTLPRHPIIGSTMLPRLAADLELRVLDRTAGQVRFD